jgi:integrase
MAYLRKHKNGWQVQVQVGVHRASAVLPNKSKANVWAAEKAAELRKIRDLGVDDREVFSNILDRYARDISPQKRGERWECIRLKSIGAHEVFRNKKVAAIDAAMIYKYTQARLKEVSDSTVRRELNLLSSVFEAAILWKVVALNPVKQIKKPKDAPHRETIISSKDVDDFLAQIPYNKKEKAQTISQCVGVALLFALETAMRMGEICSLTPSDIRGNVATLRVTKNGKRREVPLSKEAVRLLSLLPKNSDSIFGLTPSRLDALFRKYRDKGELDFNFHDSRHSSITRWALSGKIDPLNLAKMVGHSDLKMTLRYFHPETSHLANLLD